MKFQGKAKEVKSGKIVKFKLTSINKEGAFNEYNFMINGKTVKEEGDYLYYTLDTAEEILDYLKEHEYTLIEINHFKLDKYNQKVVTDILDWLIHDEIYDTIDKILSNWNKNNDALYSNFIDNYVNDYLFCSVESHVSLDYVFMNIFEMLNGYNGVYQWNYYYDGFIENEREYIQEALNNGEINQEGDYING